MVDENARSIICLAVNGNRKTADIVDLLNPEWIHYDKERTVIQTIIDLCITDTPVSAITISQRYSSVVTDKVAKSIFGDRESLISFIESCQNCGIETIPYHVEMIELDHAKRCASNSIEEVKLRINEFRNAQELSDGVMEIVSGSLNIKSKNNHSIQSEELVEEWMREKASGSKPREYNWIFPTWNKTGYLFRQSEICTFAAPTNAGKSWFALQMAEDACKNGANVAYFSGEMEQVELLERMLQMASIHESELSKKEISDKVKKRLDEIRSWDLTVFDGSITIEKIRSAVVRARAVGKKYDMVVVDHVHLMDFGKADSYRINFNRAMSIFKSEIGTKEKCAVILLAQLKKENTDDRKGRKKLRLEDIRESGGLAQISDQVFFMNRDDPQDHFSTRSIVWCAKKRRGAVWLPDVDVEISKQHNRLIQVSQYPLNRK